MPGVGGAYHHQATLLVLGAGSAPLGPLRSAIGRDARLRAGASVLPEEAGIFARLLASDGAALRDALQRAWVAVRVALGLKAGRARPK
jgi:urease accessory protein UreH